MASPTQQRLALQPHDSDLPLDIHVAVKPVYDYLSLETNSYLPINTDCLGQNHTVI